MENMTCVQHHDNHEVGIFVRCPGCVECLIAAVGK